MLLLTSFAALAVAFEVPLCPAAAIFGVPCPGCGLTRATLALLRGDFAGALRFHPLVPLLAPLYFGLLGAVAWSYVRPRSLTKSARPRAWLAGRLVTLLAWALLVLVIGVWVARFFGAFGGPAPVRSAWESLPVLRR